MSDYDDQVRKAYPGESEKELYTRQRIHKLVDSINQHSVAIARIDEHVDSMEESLKSKSETLKDLNRKVDALARSMASIEQNLATINKVAWVLATPVAALVVAQLMQFAR